MSGSRIVKCNCKHEFQDKTYGVGNRVANITGKGHANCTVCGREHHSSEAVVEKKSAKKSK